MTSKSGSGIRVIGLAALKILAFLAVTLPYASRLVSDLQKFHFELRSPSWILLGFSVGLLGQACMPMALHTLLRLNHAQVTIREATALYFVPAPAKYLPGKVWASLGLLLLVRRLGISTVDTTLIILSLNIATILGALAAGLLFPQTQETYLASLVVISLGCFLVWVCLHNLTIATKLSWLTNRRGVLAASLRCAGYWLLMGLGGCCFLQGINLAIPSNLWPTVIGALSLTAAAGTIAPFAPGGLGVRESLLRTVLLTVLSAQHATLIPAALRLWQMSLECACFLIGAILIASPNSRTAAR